MKTFKKNSWAFVLLLLFGAVFLMAGSRSALAAGPDFNLKFGDTKGNTITGNFSGKSFTFKLIPGASNSTITTYLTTDDNSICKGSSMQISGLLSDALKNNNLFAAPFNDTFKYRPAGSSDCQLYKQALPVDLFGSTGSSSSGGTSTTRTKPIEWDGATGTLSDGNSVLTIKFSDGSSINVFDSDPNDDTINFKPEQKSTGKFGGGTVSAWCQNTYFNGGGPSDMGISLSSYSDKTGSVKVCYSPLNNTQTGSITITNATPVNGANGIEKGDSCSTGADCKDGVCQKDGGECATGSCDENFVSPFAFIVCPALSFADSAIGFFYGQVEAQLCFNTGASSTAGNFTCSGDKSLGANVKNAWSIFKNIASALLVIVLLVMVISQAFGGGIFEAYTIRKLLPKLVAAIIIMQLSWILLKFAIDLSNDAGATIGNLMMAPFGGPKNMDLGSMLGDVVTIATGTAKGQVIFDVFASIAAVGIFVWAIPALPLMALYVFAGAFIAFFTLILRKLLIIMLVILAPIAFIAWLLPGTDKYWKLWSDNFTKLLVMFPLIMAMLSAGRIFAYITSTAGNGASMFNPQLGIAHLGPLPVPYMASATGFVDIVIVIVAFFAPYFLLPKTFSWGGQLLSQAGKAVENITNKGTEPAKKFLKTREEGYRAERKRKSAIRVSRNERFNILKPWQKPVDSFRSGKLDPTLGFPGSHRRRTAVTRYSAQGAEEIQKEVKEADLRASLLFEQVDDHDGLARAMAAGMENYKYETHADKEYNDAHGLVGAARRTHRLGKVSEAERMAGLNAVAKFGGGSNFRFLDRQVDRLRHGTAEERAMAKSFLDANAQTLIGKMKHLYYGEERDGAISAMVGSMSENSFVGMEGAEMEAILESLSQRAANGATPQIRAAAANDLSRVLTFYQSAINNDNIRPNIGSGVSQAVEALVDNQNLGAINGIDPVTGAPILNSRGELTGRHLHGHPGIDAAAATVGAIAPLAAALSGRIDQFGNVQSSPVAPAAATVSPTAVPAANLDIPDASGWTPRDQAYAENTTRDEYIAYRARIDRSAVDPVAYPPLTTAEQQRFEQIRASHPEW